MRTFPSAILLPRAFVSAWRKKEKGEGHRWTHSPRTWRGEGAHARPGSPPWPGGTRDPPALPCPPPPVPVPSAGGRLTRVTLAGGGGEEALPCPAVLADRLFLCFDTCAHCPMLSSLIYRPIKDSAFLQPPALLPSTPSSLRGGGGRLECRAESLLSPPACPCTPTRPLSRTPAQTQPRRVLRGCWLPGPRWGPGKQAVSRRSPPSLPSPPRVCDRGTPRPSR